MSHEHDFNGPQSIPNALKCRRCGEVLPVEERRKGERRRGREWVENGQYYWPHNYGVTALRIAPDRRQTQRRKR